MVNLVLLAENRLSLPTEEQGDAAARRLPRAVPADRGVDALVHRRTGGASGRTPAEALGVLGGLHLAVVAMFTVTEDLVRPAARAAAHERRAAWRWLLAMFRPGGGRGAVYVLVQMALLLVAAWLLRPTWLSFRWFAGHLRVHLLLHRRAGGRLPAREAGATPHRSSCASRCWCCCRLAMVLPDILYYMLWQPDVLDLSYSARHLLNPFRTLANWQRRARRVHGLSVPLALGLTGLLAYLALIHLGMRMTVQPARSIRDGPAAAAGEPGRANILY